MSKTTITIEDVADDKARVTVSYDPPLNREDRSNDSQATAAEIYGVYADGELTTMVPNEQHSCVLLIEGMEVPFEDVKALPDRDAIDGIVSASCIISLEDATSALMMQKMKLELAQSLQGLADDGPVHYQGKAGVA